MRALWLSPVLWLSSVVAPAVVGSAHGLVDPSNYVVTSSHVVRVVVHPESAEVTRETVATLPQGDCSVTIEGLPSGLDEDSLKVSARGVEARLGAVEVHDVAESPASSPDALAMADVVRIQSDSQRLSLQEATDRSVRDYLDSVRTAAPRQGAAVALQPADVAALREVDSFIRQRYSELDDRDMKRRVAKADLDVQLREAQSRIASLQGSPATASERVTVGVEMLAAGTLRIEFTYVIDDCRWRPVYSASLDSAKKQVTLSSMAAVTQSTGEDWHDVELSLSTSDPSERAEPPRLAARRLAARRPALTGAVNDPVNGGPALDIPTATIENFRLVTGGFNAEYGEQSSGVAESAVVETAYHVRYAVSGASTVMSDGDEHRVLLRTDVLPVSLACDAVPSLEPSAFVMASAKVPSLRPLLSGNVQVITDGEYVGHYVVAEHAPGSEVRLPFGSDRRVQVTRVMLPKGNETEDAGSKDIRESSAWTTTVENLRDDPVTVNVIEAVPVSDDSQIVVKLASTTTAGAKEAADRPGVMTWTLELKPSQKKDVTLAYSVRHPKDLQVASR
jgi:uncharacterized protein (TIGR02231 family)